MAKTFDKLMNDYYCWGLKLMGIFIEDYEVETQIINNNKDHYIGWNWTFNNLKKRLST